MNTAASGVSHLLNALMGSLASIPEDSGQTRRQLNEMTAKFNLLDDLRHAANGIVDLYTQVPVLEAVDIGVAYSFNNDNDRQYREYRFKFLDADVLPNRLDPDLNKEEFLALLQAAFEGGGVDSEYRAFDHFENKNVLFDSDLACLFEAADQDSIDQPDQEHVIHTNRREITRLLVEDGIDAVAAALFPRKWLMVADQFHLPTYGTTPSQSVASPSRPRP